MRIFEFRDELLKYRFFICLVLKIYFSGTVRAIKLKLVPNRLHRIPLKQGPIYKNFKYLDKSIKLKVTAIQIRFKNLILPVGQKLPNWAWGLGKVLNHVSKGIKYTKNCKYTPNILLFAFHNLCKYEFINIFFYNFHFTLHCQIFTEWV